MEESRKGWGAGVCGFGTIARGKEDGKRKGLRKRAERF